MRAILIPAYQPRKIMKKYLHSAAFVIASALIVSTGLSAAANQDTETDSDTESVTVDEGANLPEQLYHAIREHFHSDGSRIPNAEREATVRAILAASVDTHALVNTDHMFKLPLHVAALTNHATIIPLLLNAGADINGLDPIFHTTALEGAIDANATEAAAVLRAHGATEPAAWYTRLPPTSCNIQ